MANYVQPVKYEYINKNTYRQNKNIVSVNLHNVPFENNDASYSFYQCSKINSITGMNQNTTNLYYGFCACSKLVEPPSIPSSVTNMVSCFSSCSLLKNAPTIPTNVTNMTYCFQYCYNLTQAPFIPDNVTNLYNAFYYCNNISSVPHFSNSLTDMSYTFYGCSRLETVANIPSSVKSMYYTFYACYNLTGNIYIYSNQINSAYSAFGGSNRKDVYIPYTFTNGEISTTYDTLSYYYDEIGTTSNVYLHDLNSIYSTDWSYQVNTETNNATLIKYLGSETSVSIPQYIE